MKKISHSIRAFILLCVGFVAYSQNFYTARKYWEETNKPTYVPLKQKQVKGDSLSLEERTYIIDYEIYLNFFYKQLSETEKENYARNKFLWDVEVQNKVTPFNEQAFEWRPRDRVTNAAFGFWYGLSTVVLVDVDNSANIGVPFITSGLWLMGPAINPKKYEGISRTTIRANNTGKLLGLGYGAALALGVAGNRDNTSKTAFALSTIGSIGLGEAAFQWQKRKDKSAGNIEMMRHYGFLGPWVGLATLGALNVTDNSIAGFALLGSGIGGLVVGNKVYQKYNYTKGDVDVISSQTLISTAAGFAVVAAALENSESSQGLLFVPAATAIAGTLLGQRNVKGAHFTDKQGSTINLSVGGAALVGIGIMAIAEAESSPVVIGVPTLLAFITHQALFKKFKRKNLELGLQGNATQKNRFYFSMNVNPENYFIDKQSPTFDNTKSTQRLQNPLVSFKVRF